MRYGRRPLVGIGGWLAVFVVTLVLGALLAAVMVVEHVAAAFRVIELPPVRHYVLSLALLQVIRVVVFAYLVWRMLARRDPLTPRIVIAGLWLLAIAWPVGMALASAITIGSGAPLSVLDAAAFRPIGYATIWTAYLLRSDRVANTYAPAGDRLAAVFG